MTDYNAQQRKAMAAKGQALKDGSFPIANCEDASNAIQSIGRASNTATARAHIKKRVAALGCSGSTFDNWKS
jgi:hypothetical protein